jgi:heptaprenyl diphosphate synthase
MLALLTAQLGVGTRPEVVEAAVVCELTHLATLYHDDVMDSAPTRRGAPAAHEVWGNSVAILTGDLLFARASRVVAGLGPEAVRIQAATFERLCLGQLHETVGPTTDDDQTAHYIQVLADKTGSLIATSARFGAMFAGCEPSIVQQVTNYGELAGIAFQLADDVIDVRSDAETTGKTPGTDLREQVPTMPVLLLRARVATGADAPAEPGGERVPLDDATLEQDRALLELIDGDLASDDALASVVAHLSGHPVVDQTSALAHRWSSDAIESIANLPEGDVKDALISFAEALVARAA